MTKESEDGAALRAQQVREARSRVEKGKYQRLNRFGLSDNILARQEDDRSTDDIREDLHLLILCPSPCNLM